MYFPELAGFSRNTFMMMMMMIVMMMLMRMTFRSWHCQRKMETLSNYLEAEPYSVEVD